VVQSPPKCQWYKKTNNSFHNETYNQTDKMKLIILKFHIFYTYFTIKEILEVNKKQNKNLKQIRIIYNI
jgi:ribosome biogenesis GTPase A